MVEALYSMNRLLKLKDEIAEASKNPQALILEAIHSAGFSGAFANPLMAPESALNGLNSTLLEQFVANEYRAKVGGPAEDGTPETDDLAIWSEISGGTKKNRILGFPGYRARDLLGPPLIVPMSIACSSPQPSIDHKVLESMVDKMIETKFANFLQTFTNYESIEDNVYKPNLDFLEVNDDEVADLP